MNEVTRPRRPRRPAGTRNHPVTSTIGGAIESAVSVIEELHTEMEDWASNMEGNSMEHLPKYDEVNEAKDALESPKDELEGLDLPEEVSGVEVSYTQDTRQSANSRSGRLNNALDELRAAEAGLDSEVERLEELLEKAREAKDTLEAQISELESVNFPGMY